MYMTKEKERTMILKYLSTTETIDWLKKHAKIGNAKIDINRKFLKMLEETGRLFPDKIVLFKKYYSLNHLKLYARDVEPR